VAETVWQAENAFTDAVTDLAKFQAEYKQALEAHLFAPE
jgi:hypothetical protein